MATREILLIDEELCDGCGDCIVACEEAALKIIEGKARLISDSYCDGLGACLGECPQGALTIETREAPEFDEEAVTRHLARTGAANTAPAMPPGGGCPGSAVRNLGAAPPVTQAADSKPMPTNSLLGHWPVQLMLVPPHAPFLQDADLLICADCVPFTVPDFHERYLRGRAVVVGCPKLDDLNHYLQKLKEMYAQARPRRITVLRMEVPCCGGIAQAAIQTRNEVTPRIPLEVHTIGIQGGIVTEIVPPGGDANQSAFGMVG